MSDSVSVPDPVERTTVPMATGTLETDLSIPAEEPPPQEWRRFAGLTDAAPSVSGRPDSTNETGARPVRRLADSLSVDVQLAVTVLSFIRDKGTVKAQELLESGPSGRMFSMLWDLYDEGLLSREGDSLQIAPRGNGVLKRAGL